MGEKEVPGTGGARAGNNFINKILSVVVGGNPLPLGGGRSLVNSKPLTLAFDVLLYSS